MESLGISGDPSICVYLNFEVSLVVYRTLFQFSLNFLPTVFEICGNDVTALQYAARPGITGASIGPSKLGFWVIEVLMEDFAICLYQTVTHQHVRL